MQYQVYIVRDENIDIHCREKYFNQTGWYAALENFHKKQKIVGGRALLVTSTSLKKKVVLSVKDA